MAPPPTAFDAWLSERFREGGAFTVLIVLVEIGDLSVEPRRSTHLHVIGDAITWAELKSMFTGAGVPWQGVAFFEAPGETGAEPGLVPDAVARRNLDDLVAHIHADRMVLNDGQFFDTQGRRIRIDEATAH